MKKRILFVDDEPLILEGLRRTLRNLHQEWEMHFAGSGQEALDCLGQKTFDVVVSDMRMPGMDGAQLLTEVKRSSPQTARIILSGHSEQEFIMKSVRIAHQYLAKPCEVDNLKSVVMRTCALRSLLADNSLERILSNLDSLPSLPSLYTEIMGELQSPNTSLPRIGKIISQDLGMTAKILQLVNSAFSACSAMSPIPPRRSRSSELIPSERSSSRFISLPNLIPPQYFPHFRRGCGSIASLPGFWPKRSPRRRTKNRYSSMILSWRGCSMM